MGFTPLDTSPDAVWKQRFRAASIAWTKIATQNPAHGLVCTNKDGIYQLYAWEVETGQLRQLTNQPAGVVGGMISADGQHVYYHRDEQGNEIGHYVRVPFGGDDAEDVTSDMPSYASFFIEQSKSGAVTGFLAAGPNGFEIYVMVEGSAPKRIAQFRQLTFGPMLSYNGEIAVVDTAEKTGTLDTSLIAIDTTSGDVIAELWDGENTSHNFGLFSPLPGDFRILATTSKSGYERPLIWNPRTGERHDLALDAVPGQLTPWCWSLDAKHILLGQLYQAEYQLYLYYIETRVVTKLQHPAGVLGGYNGNAYFVPSGEIFLTWQDSATPSQLIALDGTTGKQTRVVLAAGETPAGQKWKSVTFTSDLENSLMCVNPDLLANGEVKEE